MSEETAFALAFAAIEGVGSIRLRRLREAFPTLEAAWGAPAEELVSIAGIPPDLAQAIAAQRPALDPGGEVQRLARAGVESVCVWEEAYPAPLREIHDPPALLYFRGRLPDFSRAVALVGTRECSGYGSAMAQGLARDLARAGVVVVSGLALGIDAVAHRGALETGTTVAVLGSGLDRISPVSNRGLAQRIAERGAILTEYPLGIGPAPGQFPARNRIVSGLCQAVVVVEARERSGALITAEMALEQNREVMALPGPADSLTSLGPHRLIQQGARLITGVEDVFSELGWAGGRPSSEQIELPDEEARVFAVLSLEPQGVDRIALLSGLSPAALAGILLTLELKGLILALPGARYGRKGSPG